MRTLRKVSGPAAAFALAGALAAFAAPPAAAQSTLPGPGPGPMSVGLSVYGWFPDIAGRTRFGPGGGSALEVDVGTILDNLEFTFQGTLDLMQDRYGLLLDLVYLNTGQSRSRAGGGTIGGTQIPMDAVLNVELDAKSTIWTIAGYHRAVESPAHTLDVLVGARYLDAEQASNWTVTGNVGPIPAPGRTGRATASIGLWDAIVGLRGRIGLGAGGAWFVPYHVDLGAGESQLTWQAMLGIGYAFRGGEAVAGWRYLSYEMKSGSPIADLTVSGPLVGATFRW